MKALGYLVRRQMINFLKGQLKKPGLLILYVVAFGFILFSVIMSDGSNTDIGLPSGVLPAAVFVLFTVMMFINLRSALSRGTTVFGLEDVNFLFTSPVRPQLVLLYGVLRQMGTSLLILFVLLFQIANLRNLFGMSISGIVMLFIAWFLLAVLSQVIAMCLYSLLAPREGARRKASYLLNGCALLLVVIAGALLLRNPSLDGVLALVGSPWWRAVPLSGWLSGAVVLANQGSWLYAMLFFLLSVGLGAGVFALTFRADPDYYEDVLDLTLEKHEQRQAAKQPSAQANSMVRRNVKAGKSGLTRGHGASVFFFKQLREQRREGILFLDFRTLMLVMCSAIICIPMFQAFQEEGSNVGMMPLYIVLGCLIYVQLIFNATSGRFTQEQLKPYLYLTPCSPRGKLLMCNLMPAIKGAVDGLLCCVGVCLFLQLPIDQGIAAGLLLGFATLFFTGAELVADWLIGENRSKILTMIVYFLCVFILIAPAVALFVALLLVPGLPPLLAYGAAALYLAGVTALLFLLLGGILHNMESAA